MTIYHPDRWCLVKITTPTTCVYKVFAGWYGGFCGSDSWKLNSGIISLVESNDFLDFIGYTGSIYRCYKQDYGLSGLMTIVLESWQHQLVQEGKKDSSICLVNFEDIPQEYDYLD